VFQRISEQVVLLTVNLEKKVFWRQALSDTGTMSIAKKEASSSFCN